MSVLSVISAVRHRGEAFFVSWVWLLPALFPLALQGGRGLFNILFFTFVIWAAFAARALRGPLPALLPIMLGLMLAAYLPSLLFAIDPGRGLYVWFRVALYAGGAVAILAVLQRRADGLDTLVRALGTGGALAFAVACASLFWMELTTETYRARLSLRAVDLPFCLPFMLAWTMGLVHARGRIVVAIAVTCAVTAFVIVADERSPMIGLSVSLIGLGLLFLAGKSWRFRIAAGGAVAATAIAALALASQLDRGRSPLRGLSTDGTLFDRLDSFSSLRLTLWRNALEHPPANPWFGVGMGNAQHYDAVLRLPAGLVRSLHNLWFDAWYETGIVGTAALAAMLTVVLATSVRAMARMDPRSRRTAGLFLIAAVTLLAQLQFSISYASREFGTYLLIALAALVHLSNRRTVTAPPAATPPVAARDRSTAV